MATTKELRSYLDRETGKKQNIEQSITSRKLAVRKLRRDVLFYEKAMEIIKLISLKMQQKLQFHISDITSLALEAVFDNPYKLDVEFIERRNKTECDLMFSRDGNQIDPISASGVGAVDVASFALRIASWSMNANKTDNVIILDEPFKHLKGEDANKRVLQMIREVSKMTGLQIIMISDERISREDIIENADKVFEVTIRKGVSKVKEI